MKTKLKQTQDYLLLIDVENRGIECGEVGVNMRHSKLEVETRNMGGYGSDKYYWWYKKCIAYYPLTKEAKELDLPLLPNPFEEVDVEKLAQEYTMSIFGELDDFIDITEGFKAGYKAAQSNKQFSLEDVKKAIEMARMTFPTDKLSCDRYSTEHIVQTLSTQQLPKEFIPEYQRVRDLDNRDINGDYNSKLILKTTTNSSGKIELVGTYK